MSLFAALELDDNIDDVFDIFLYLLACNAEPGLHNHQYELFYRQGWGIGVQGGNGTGVTGIDGAQVTEGFLTAQLAHHDTIRTQAQTRFD